MKPVYLIDSSIYIFRYYFSNRPSQLSDDGREVSTALAFARWLCDFLLKEKPEQVGCFFDESLESGVRHEIDANYKSNRALPDEALAYELLACKKIAELIGVPSFASSRYEADDLIAAAAQHCYSQGHEPVLVTRDKDLAQILTESAGLFWDYGYDEPIGYDSFSNEFGIEPKYMADYLAIIGDTSDAIVGIRGVGKKTASALFKHFNGWQALKQNIDAVATLPLRGAKTLSLKLKENIDLVEHNLRLTTLMLNSLSPEQCKLTLQKPNIESLDTLMKNFNAPVTLRNRIAKL